MFDPERERRIAEEIRLAEQIRKEEQLVKQARGDVQLQRELEMAEQIRKEEQLRKQALGDDQLRKDLELVQSAEKMRKLTEPSEALTAALKPMQDAMRGAGLTKQIQDAIGGGEMARLTRQMQDTIGSAGKQIRDAIGGSNSRLTDIIHYTDTPTFPDLSNVRTMGDHVQKLIHAQAESAEASTARRAVLHLEEQIREFEEELDDESDVGIKLVSFGQTMVVHIETVSHIQPNLIVFVGNLDDEAGPRVRLVQHMSQLSFLLVGLPRREPEKPRRPIGFITSEEEPDAK